MTGGAFAAAFAESSSRTVCFSADGSERSWDDFAQQAGRVHACLSRQPGQVWAVDLDDPYEFAFSVFGLWAAGKTAVIAAAQMLRHDDPRLRMDGVILAQDGGSSRPSISLAALPDEARAIPSIDPDSSLVLYTSGSTGRPKETRRALKNAEAEIEVFESLWGRSFAGARIHSTVSHRHVYGLLFRILWPLWSGRPFAGFDLQYPEHLVGPFASGNILITSPALLKRIGHLDGSAGGWRAVFSSGGLLPESAAADSIRLLGTCPIEVLGSTETSGVAWRRQQPPDAQGWSVLPRANVRIDDEGFLEVESPFSGVNGWLRMGDMARFSPDGRLELLGRGDNVAKIEDKRVSLTEIEQLLMTHPTVAEAVAIPMTDDARQFVAAAVRLTPQGRADLDRLGRLAFGEQLRNYLRPKTEAIALPRRFRFVDEIPMNAQGKRTREAIERMFDE